MYTNPHLTSPLLPTKFITDSAPIIHYSTNVVDDNDDDVFNIFLHPRTYVKHLPKLNRMILNEVNLKKIEELIMLVMLVALQILFFSCLVSTS